MPMYYGGDNVRFSDNSVQNTAATGFGFKNRIINGAMMIDQRNAGGSVALLGATANFPVDRWAAYVTQNSKLTAQQNAGAVTPPTGFKNYLGFTSSSAYSILSTDYFITQQNIEGFNVADLAWGTANAQTITLSFRVYSSLTGTFGGSLRNNGDNRSYPFTYTISSANTWTTISITVAGDTTGTWTTDNSSGLRVCFGLGVGSSFSGTAGAWTGTANVFSATGATSVVGTNGATFYITGVQLEKGSTATSFDYRPYGAELALCQRYCPVIDTSAFRTFPVDGATGGYMSYPFPVQARVAATGTTVSGTFILRTAGGAATPAVTLSFNSSDTQSILMNVSGASGLTTGQAILITGSAGSKIIPNGCEL